MGLWNRELHFWTELPGKILTALGDVTQWLFKTGQNIMAGLISGISSAGGAVTQAIIDHLPGPVKSVLGAALGLGGGGTTKWSDAFQPRRQPETHPERHRRGGRLVGRHGG